MSCLPWFDMIRMLFPSVRPRRRYRRHRVRLQRPCILKGVLLGATPSSHQPAKDSVYVVFESWSARKEHMDSVRPCKAARDYFRRAEKSMASRIGVVNWRRELTSEDYESSPPLSKKVSNQSTSTRHVVGYCFVINETRHPRVHAEPS